MKKDKGMKFDTEKIRLELLSPMALNGVARVLTFGARKYDSHNWRKGIELSRILGAALRHLLAVLGGEDFDPESGLPHLDHLGCCVMFARELWETRPDLDDRYKSKSKVKPRKWRPYVPGFIDTTTPIRKKRKRK